MQLTHVAQYPVALFDLVGHGADPLAYEVVTTADLAALQVGDAIVCRGFVLGVGAASDFEAVEVASQHGTVVVPLTGTPSLQLPAAGAQGPFAIREGASSPSTTVRTPRPGWPTSRRAWARGGWR